MTPEASRTGTSEQEGGFKGAAEMEAIARTHPGLDHDPAHAQDVAQIANEFLDAGRSKVDPAQPESRQQHRIDVLYATNEAEKMVDHGQLLRNASEGVRHAVAARINPESVYEKRGITGLQNKDSFLKMVQAAEALGQGKPESQFVIIADANNLKRVNDKLGHPAGDALLIKIAVTLREVADELGIDHDRLAIIGGDEFGAVIPADLAELFAVTVEQRIAAWIESGEGATYPNNRSLPGAAARKLGAGLTVTFGPTEKAAEDAMPQAKLDAKYGSRRTLQKSRQLLDRLRGGR